MWYRLSDIEAYEKKILASDLERLIRQRLHLKQNYAPDTKQVEQLVIKALYRLKDKYQDYYLVRRHVSGDSLMPVVEAVVDTIL